jgi:chromosomal replication initiator protein
MTTAREIWEAALGRLQVQVSKPNYETWLKDTQGIRYENGVFLISTPNTFIAEWLQSRLLSLIENTLSNIIGKMVEVQFFIVSAKEPALAQSVPANQYDGGMITRDMKTIRHNPLNPRFTFDNFTVGSCNELAYSAAYEVAMKPGEVYNPLFIFSNTGLGKTHLMQAIGNSVKTQSKTVMYTNAELLTREFVNSIRNKKTEEFNEKYRSVDVLLVDDFQFFSGKKGTQQSFYHLFNDLQENNRQIVITCDTSPRDIDELGENLRSRLEGGLVADIKSPDFETRLAILEDKAKKRQEAVPIPVDVLKFIATHLHNNIRELEGGLNRIITYARVNKSAPDVDLATKAISSIVGQEEKMAGAPITSVDRVIEAVAGYYNLTPDALTGKLRDRTTTLARQIAMYLLREYCHCRLSEIGKLFGGRDHTTVIYSCNKITTEIGVNQQLNQSVGTILGTLKIHKNSHP